MAFKMMPAAELVEDMTLYPRETVDDTNIADMVQAIRAGEKLPPVIADRDSRRIIDGVHRRRAWIRVGGEGVEIPVELKGYSSEEDILLDAARCNSRHGKKLGRVDQARVLIFARRLGISDERTAEALAVPVDRVTVVLASRVAEAPSGPVPLKLGTLHLSGKEINQEQAEAIKRQRGIMTRRMAKDLRTRLESDIANLEDTGVCSELWKLAEAIATYVPKETVKAA